MTTSADTTLTIAPLTIPASLDAADADEFLAFAELNRQICALDAGRPDIAPAASEMLPAWLDPTDELSLGFVARRGDETVGMAAVYLAQEKDAKVAVFDLLVLPENWGSGVEEALLARVEEEARGHGRSSLQTWTLHRADTVAAADPSERMLVPPTGWGRVPVSPLAGLLERDGFSLEQVERNSEFDLRADPAPLKTMLTRAVAQAGPDYHQVTWLLPTPPERREQFAAILARIATDVPSGALEVDEEAWDAARVERREAQFAEAGQLVSVAAVVHEPTGTLAAYNELVIGADRTATTHQFGTLVHAEHRGHRLGTIVKCANLLRWRELVPDSPVVSTFNAEENRPMLDINEAIGFIPVSYAAAWQKTLR